MKCYLSFLIALTIVLTVVIPVTAQTPNEEIRTGKLVKRSKVNGVDNYAYAAYSFEFGGNGSEIQKLALTTGISFSATARCPMHLM
jgi:hypothetical protein